MYNSMRVYEILCYIVIKCYTINYYIDCIAVYRYNIYGVGM